MKNVLVIGASTGYGLASRIAAAWAFGAKTLGVFFERAPKGGSTGTAGYYNTVAFHEHAKKDELYAASLNGDAFSDEIKRQAADLIRNNLRSVDLVIYSLAWLPDGSGLILAGGGIDQSQQIWVLPYPEGQARKITNDGPRSARTASA